MGLNPSILIRCLKMEKRHLVDCVMRSALHFVSAHRCKSGRRSYLPTSQVVLLPMAHLYQTLGQRLFN